MAGVISVEEILKNDRAYRLLKELFGDAIPPRPSAPAPAPPIFHATQPASPSISPPRPSLPARACSPLPPSRNLVTPSPASSPAMSAPSRPSSAMDITLSNRFSDLSESEDSDASSVRHSSAEDDSYTLVGKKRSRRPKPPAPSKAPKITAQAPPSGNCRPASPKSGAKLPTAPAPPPLFIQDKSKWTAVSSWCAEKRINFKSAKTTQQGIKVLVPTSDDHRALSRMLRERNVSFHTYTLPEERLLRVVIRGIPKEISSEEVKASLASQNLPVHEVHRMVRGKMHEPYDMVMAVLDHTDSGKGIFKLESLCHLSGISIEAPRRKGFTSQCHRCQLYGHSARNCFARPRCVKCLGDHATAECKRPKDRALCEEPPACVLCGQVGHPANYRGCPKAPRASKPRASPRAPAPVTSATPLSPQRPSPWGVLNTQSAFPPLPSRPQTQVPSTPVLPASPQAHRPTHLAAPPAQNNKNVARLANQTRPTPAQKATQFAANTVPVPTPVYGASPQTRAETDLGSVGRFLGLLDSSVFYELAEDIARLEGNGIALFQLMVTKYKGIIDSLSNFRINP